MGTTLTLAYSLNDELFVAHVGDSRCYLCRGDTLYQLTRDHSLVDEMVRHGVLSAKQAAGHHLRHLVTNALGGGYSDVKVEVHKLKLESGDVVLLCSDGLSEMLSGDAISQVIRTQSDPEQSCRQLVAAANEAGGKDNITVVVARFGDTAQ
jgi:protein phosphatase